jgi:hypothetical protein
MSFADSVRRFSALTIDRQRQVMKIAAVEVGNSVSVGSLVTGSQGTPVDTGFARNSWGVDGSTGTAALTAALASIEPGESRTIVGGAVYLRGLEEGRAKRLPAGWVRLTIAQWPRIVSYALAQVRR